MGSGGGGGGGRVGIVEEFSVLCCTSMAHKIWAKIISAHAKKCNRMEVSVAEGRWVGQKGNSEQTSRGMNA